MKKSINILVSFILSLMLVMNVFTVFAEDNANVSKNVTNVTWEQVADLLYINGTGDMTIEYDYITEIPWYSIRSEISKIVVGEGITSIYDSAFADFSHVTEVSLPNSLRRIGTAAFISCTSLESITLPYKTTYIDSGAFCNCSSLKNIVIPGSVTKISNDIFYNCKDVTVTCVPGSYTDKFVKENKINHSATLSASSEILVRVNGEYVDFDQPPVIINDRTLVPARMILEAMGVTVDWDGATRTVLASRDNISISMAVDTNIIYQTIDGKTTKIETDVPAQIVGDRTMFPARAITQSFLAWVDWDGATRTVIVED